MERVVDPLAKKPSVLHGKAEFIFFAIMVAALVVAPFLPIRCF